MAAKEEARSLSTGVLEVYKRIRTKYKSLDENLKSTPLSRHRRVGA